MWKHRSTQLHALDAHPIRHHSTERRSLAHPATTGTLVRRLCRSTLPAVPLLFFLFFLAGCEGSDWDRHALTGPEANRLIASVEIKPSGAVVEPDGLQQFTAEVKSARGAVVSRNVTWRSLDESVVRVDASGNVIGMNEGVATLEATHQGVTGRVTVDVHGEVVGIRLQGTSLDVGEGQTAQLEATYIYANGAERPAGPLHWQSEDPTILAVTSDGLVQGIRGGMTRVRIRGRGHEVFLEGLVRSGNVDVVEVIAPRTSLAVDEEVQFWAAIRDAQGNGLFRPVDWSSSNSAVASVSAAGVVRGRAAGTTRIRARAGGVEGEIEVTVGTSGSQAEARPGAVTNLSVASTETNSVTLRFREVDDGLGKPAHYEVRYAEAPLGFGWGQAMRVTRGSCKAPIQGREIGGTRTCTVESLQPDTKYDFQLVAFHGTMEKDAVYGPLSNIAAGTTQKPPIQVQVLPSGATLDLGGELELRATVRDLYGNTLGRTVSWSSSRSSVASVSASGNNALVRALSAGEADVSASTDGVAASSKIRVVRPSSGLRRNEPVGFGRIAEHDFSCRPSAGCALAGQWSESGNGFHASNLSLVDRADAPVSGPRVIRTRFPKGLRSGSGPVSFSGWAPAAAEYRAIYVSKWIRISGNDYENHPVLTKMGWLGFGESTHDTQGTLGIQTNPTTGRVEVVRQLQPTFRQQGHTGGAIWGTSNAVRVGQWQHWELVLELNDVGRKNGVLRWWIDDNLVISRTDMVFVTPGNERGFFSYRWNPTWGGAGDFAKSRDDYMEIDHIYISGLR